MIKTKFESKEDNAYQILCLGAHSDDIEIGCGGTLFKWLQEYENLSFYWVVFSADKTREKEALESANSLLKSAKNKNIVIHRYQENYFPYIGGEIKNYFDKLKRIISPDIIFTHYRNDLHQDHRLISELTWNTFRDHFILEYEIPKYDGDLAIPNFFVHLTEFLCRNKIEHLQIYFKSQLNKHWFSPESLKAILRIRGVESNAPERFAEAFYCRKIVF